MITLDEVRNIEFSRTLGGYKTTEVDDFIDQCVELIEHLTNEKNEANTKLSVLADKLVEYRQDEDSIRTALLNAQKAGDTVVREANQNAEKILQDAKDEAARIHEIAAAQITAEQRTLDRLKEEVAAFKNEIIAKYRFHLGLLDKLPGEVANEVAAPVEEPAESKPAPVEPEPVVEEPVAEEPITISAEPVEEILDEPEDLSSGDPIPADDPADQIEDLMSGLPVKTEAPAKKRFADLKFGDDYHMEDDPDGEEIERHFRKK